jgi:transposase
MVAWIGLQRSWLVVERLPGYAPELNPVELVWGNVKTCELANLCPDTIDEAEIAADAALGRIGDNEQMCFNFLEHTGLSI